ncbi:MAG TPA: hydrogenase-1 expression HyaE [Burkholderiales bacterium]
MSLTLPSMPPAAEHPLFRRLAESGVCPEVAAETFEGFIAQPGNTLLFFAEEPAKYREALDLAVILPELAQAFSGRFRAGLLMPETARALQPRYGFNKWPALVMLRGGEYVGAVAGLRDWSNYVSEIGALLEAPASRPPSVGIAVKHSGGDAHCH